MVSTKHPVFSTTSECRSRLRWGRASGARPEANRLEVPENDEYRARMPRGEAEITHGLPNLAISKRLLANVWGWARRKNET